MYKEQEKHMIINNIWIPACNPFSLKTCWLPQIPGVGNTWWRNRLPSLDPISSHAPSNLSLSRTSSKVKFFIKCPLIPRDKSKHFWSLLTIVSLSISLIMLYHTFFFLASFSPCFIEIQLTWNTVSVWDIQHNDLVYVCITKQLPQCLG